MASAIVHRLARDIFTSKIDHFDREVEPFEGGAIDFEVEDAACATSIEVSLTSPKKHKNYDYGLIYEDSLSH